MASVAGGDRWVAVARDGATAVTVWEWQLENTVELPAGMPVLGLHAVRKRSGEDPNGHVGAERLSKACVKLLALGEGGKVVEWDVTPETLATRPRPRAWGTVSGARGEAVRKLKLCGWDADVQTMPELAGELVDCCQVSPWSAVGISESEVVYLSEGVPVLRFEGWHGAPGTARDPEERLLGVTGSSACVCVSSSFGNLHVLEPETLEWTRTIPVGVLAPSLAMAGAADAGLVALGTAAGSAALLHLHTASLLPFYDVGPRQTGPDARDPVERRNEEICPCCRAAPRAHGSLASSNGLMACRDFSSGCTLVRSQASRRRWTVVDASTGPAKLRFVGKYLVVCGPGDAKQILILVVAKERCLVARRIALPAACVAFDVDVQRRNRIVVLCADAVARVYSFRNSGGGACQPLQAIEFSDGPPELMAAHSGQLAFSRGAMVTVLLNPGAGPEQRVERSFPQPVTALTWHGPFCVLVNGGAEAIELAPAEPATPR